MAEEDEHSNEEGSHEESTYNNEHRRPSDIPAFRGLRRRSEDLREKEEARARAAAAVNGEFPPQPGAQHMNRPVNGGSARFQPEKLTRGLRQNPPNSGKERRGSSATFVVGESARKLTRGLSSNHAPTSKRLSYSSTESRNNSVVSSAPPPSYHRPPRAPDPDGTRLPNAMVDDATTDVDTLENDDTAVPEEQQYDEESASFVTRENSVDGRRESSVVVGGEDSGIERETDQTPASAPGPTIEPETSTTDEEQQEVTATTGDNTSRANLSAPPVETAPASTAPASTTLGDESLVEARRVEEDDSPPEGMLQAEEVDHAAEEERKQEMERQRRQFRNRLAFVVCLCLALAIVLLAVFIRPQDDIDTEAPTMYPTGAPTEAPTFSSETVFRQSLPAYSQESLIDPDSVQSQALDWLTDSEEEFQNMTDWRREQLFALASFYYAFAGRTWGIDSWLGDQSECYWFSTIDGILWGEKFLFSGDVDPNRVSSMALDYISRFAFVNGTGLDAEAVAEQQRSSNCDEDGKLNFFFLGELFSLEDQTDPPVFIPPEMELLEDLLFIDLSRNGINTSLTSLLPIQISNIPSLEVLYLHGTETRPQYIHGSIPSYVGEFPSLKFLDLGWNELTGTLPTELAKLDLYELDLGFNCLEGQIPTEIGLMTDLTWLELQANALTGTLPTEIFGLTNLEVLGLPVSVALPANIHQLLPNVTLSFSGQSRCSDNNITAPSVVFPYMVNQTDLFELDLRGQGLIGSIPTEIGLMTNLIQLSISDNFLTGSIPSELGLCTNLLRVEMSNCALDGPLPTEIGMLAYLQFFNAGKNAISGSLPSELGNLGDILSLDLRGNQLSGQMPSELGVVPLLNMVLTDNELEGSIPSEFGQLFNLVWMDLANNQGLLGSLPSELGLLGGDFLGYLPVFRFDVTNTSISGTIPVELGRGLLLEFNATGTQLSGTVPEEICSLENEDCSWINFGQSMPCHLNFDCSDQLCGCSCDCQTNTSDSTAGVVSLQTTTDSPQDVTTFGNVAQPGISGHHTGQDISSFLPDYSLESVTTNSSSSPARAVRWLLLEYPDFNGLPTWRKQQLVALSTVYYSTGGNNGEAQLDSWMDSSVDECAWSGGECTAEGKYERLDLSSKGLAGQIPPEISLLVDLKALNLSSNQLSGPIPTEIGLMTQLTNLELHNNQLTGPIPSELGSLWNLELLRLGTPGGNNSFVGEIPNELRVLTEYGSLQLEWGDLRINFETEATERQPSEGTAGHGH